MGARKLAIACLCTAWLAALAKDALKENDVAAAHLHGSGMGTAVPCPYAAKRSAYLAGLFSAAHLRN